MSPNPAPSERRRATIVFCKHSRAVLAFERKQRALRVGDKIEIHRHAALNGDLAALDRAEEGLKEMLKPYQPFRALTIQIPREADFGRWSQGRSPRQTRPDG